MTARDQLHRIRQSIDAIQSSGLPLDQRCRLLKWARISVSLLVREVRAGRLA